MFSQRLLNILEFVLKITTSLQVCAVKYDKENCLIYTDTDIKTKRNVYANLLLVTSWIFGVLIQIFYFYKQGDVSRMNLGLAFVGGGLIFLVVSTITAFYPTGCCRNINGLFNLLRYLQSKRHSNLNY